jgi:DNA-binding NtrC family response regulator
MSADKHVLIIDDEPSWVELLSRDLKRHDYQVRVAYDAAQGRAAIEQGFDGVVLLDLRLPDGDGLDLLEPFRRINPNLRIVMMTAHGTHADERQARERGVYLFVSKHEPKERFVGAVENAFQDRAQAEKIKLYRDLVERRFQFRTIMSDSPRMQHLFDMLMQIVDSRVTVLLQGESGTGKELVARALHYEGPRKDQPFVAVNCGGIPETLLESELFGHERGSFTGAVASKKGKFELADGGTLFLDEIGEMPLHLQVKLLRVLQERQVERIGGSGPRPIDVRIVSATHRDLMEMVREKRFREDLYYRLAVFPVMLPPLRDREGDIPMLARHFLKKALAEERKESPSRISPAAMAALESYPFPGNVRELENVISRAVLVSTSDAIEPRDLPMTILDASSARAHKAFPPALTPTTTATLPAPPYPDHAGTRPAQAGSPSPQAPQTPQTPIDKRWLSPSPPAYAASAPTWPHPEAPESPAARVPTRASSPSMRDHAPGSNNDGAPHQGPGPSSEVIGARDELIELVRAAQNEPRFGLERALEVLYGRLSDLPRADEVEFALIERALSLAAGNVNEAARALGLSRATIYRRLRRERHEPGDHHDPRDPDEAASEREAR